MAELIVVALLALAAGLLLGWLLASRRAGTLDRDLAVARARADETELIRRTRDTVERERNDAHQELRGLKERSAEREAAHARTLDELKQARDAMTAQFGHAAAQALETAQAQFLARAQQRFSESEKMQGERIAQLLQPVNDRLTRYEETVTKVEQERRSAFGELDGQIKAMRDGQERVSTEAARLVNALRNAPKARGRWGEQQLRNVLETCGLAEHTDFAMEVSVATGDGGRLRPDAIVRVPGGKSLIIDAKVSLNAYQDAHEALDDDARRLGLSAHAQSMRTHVTGLAGKSYWAQFDDTPEYVVMFVPGEHFLTAALEHDPTLWDFAFDKRVLLATPTNLIAIARTVSAVWRQEKLAGEARAIAEQGRDLYARLCTMGTHVGRLGKNLATANDAYNAFVGSLESQVLTQARRFEALNVDTAGKPIDTPPLVEQAVRPLTKLAAMNDTAG